MRLALLAVLLICAAPLAAQTDAPEPDPTGDETAGEAATAPVLRPMARPPSEVVDAILSARADGFLRWLTSFRGRALTQGVRPEVFDAAFDGVAYAPDVKARSRERAGFAQPIWDFMDAAVTEERIARGEAVLDNNVRMFDALEARYGVDREILTAIWGVESAYGTQRGDADVIAALATLAYDSDRPRFFEAQLVAALKILQEGEVARDKLRGAWSGTMGHTSLIPTTYIVDAVDFDGDGRRDIWSDSAADALASTAAFLARHGWEAGVPWGVEVLLPDEVEGLQLSAPRLPSEWARLGVTDTDGAPIADYGPATLLLPAGANGPAFLRFGNFDVLERYANADAYALAVGHLADRLEGARPLASEWPRDDRALTPEEQAELQLRLTQAGFDTGGVDGKIGPATIDALRAYQRAEGLLPDGYASLSVLEALR
ncbi:lytic murein transglycosylase [Palleronia sediminis]|nr:lytic murein transglycosylase [Palleronia sediminis]